MASMYKAKNSCGAQSQVFVYYVFLYAILRAACSKCFCAALIVLGEAFSTEPESNGG